MYRNSLSRGVPLSSRAGPHTLSSQRSSGFLELVMLLSVLCKFLLVLAAFRWCSTTTALPRPAEGCKSSASRRALAAGIVLLNGFFRRGSRMVSSRLPLLLPRRRRPDLAIVSDNGGARPNDR